ncbi:hypothetical protein BAE44_0014981, partial [Dichanthelium oligosanthes]
LLLVMLIPLALRATSLLLGGYARSTTTSRHRQSPIRSRSSGDATATATGRGASRLVFQCTDGRIARRGTGGGARAPASPSTAHRGSGRPTPTDTAGLRTTKVALQRG